MIKKHKVLIMRCDDYNAEEISGIVKEGQEYEQLKRCVDEWKALKRDSLDRGRERIAATQRDLRRSANRHVRQLERSLKQQIRRLNALLTQMEMAPAPA